MSVGGVLRIFPHREGPWLVRAGQVVLGVPPEIGSRLYPLNGTRTTPAELRAQLAASGVGEALVVRLATGLDPGPFSWRRFWRTRFPVWARLPLVTASVVGRLAHRCAPLVRPRGLILLGVLGLTGLGVPVRVIDGSGTTVVLVWGVALLVVSALWHEIGHAAALQRSGYAPGRLGMGMLFILPVLFVDVTPVALLPRRHRLLVNVAGPVFQLALAAVFKALALAPFLPVWVRAGLQLAAISATLAVTWSLWPFIRSDGYWLVCDALGIPGLDRPLPAGAGRKTRGLTALLRLTNAAFLLLVGAGLTISVGRRWGWPGWPLHLGVPMLAWAGILGLWVALTARILYLVRLTTHDLRA